MVKKQATVEFENSDPQVEQISTDINPQEINQDPDSYARKIASEKGEQYDQIAGFTVPRDFVMLPSKGRIYPPDSPLHNMEEIEVRHLTAADEDILTSRSLLRSGTAIDTLLDNVIVNQSIKEDVISLTGVPSWMLILLNKILETTNTNNILEVWPNLELYMHGGMNFGPYKKQFKKI